MELPDLAARSTARRALAWAWFSGVVLAAPTLLPRSPPMTDLPMHAGVVGLLLHWGDDSFVPKGLYWLNLGHPNQLFHGVAYLLCKVFGTRLGLGLAAALPQVGIVGGGAIFARHVRAPWWSSLWLAPLALGWTYFWGLAPNLYGLALFLPAVVAVDRFVREPTRRGALALTLAYALLFFAHETAMFAALAVHALLALVRPARTPRVLVLVASPAIAAVALAAADVIALTRIHTAAERGFAGDVRFTGPLRRLLELPETIFGSHPVPVLVALVALYAAAALSTRRLASKGESLDRAPRLRERLDRHRFLAAGLGLLAAYFVVPEQLFGVTMLHARFAGYAWALLLPACVAGLGFTRPPARPQRLAVLASVAALIALPVVSAPAFAQSHRFNEALDRLMSQMARGQAVIVQPLHPRRPEDLFNAISCGRVLAERGGRCLFDFTRTSISPLRMEESLIWSRIGERGGLRQELRPKEDLRAYRYLVLCCASDPEAEEYRAMLAPYAGLVTADDGWLLFESKLPRIAPNAPESLLFEPAAGPH